jgi:hypothetical protein
MLPPVSRQTELVGPGVEVDSIGLKEVRRRRSWVRGRPRSARQAEARPEGKDGAVVVELSIPTGSDRGADVETTPAWCWVGAHGGAGTSALAVAAGTGVEVGALSRDQHLTVPLPIVVVARTSAHGLTQAQRVAAIAAGPDGFNVLQRSTRVMGLVLVADAPGRLPKPLGELKHLVSGGYSKVWEVPWVEAWRLGDPPEEANTPKNVRRLVNDLRSLTLGSVIHLRSRPDYVTGLQQYQHNYH